MTVWIVRQQLTPDEEEHIRQRTHVVLPFDNMPDMSGITSQAGCRKLLQTLYPDDPPETVAGRLDRVWKRYSGLQKEDTVGVPLKSRNELALAEVTGDYCYERAADGTGRHLISVTWYPNAMSLRAGKLRDALSQSGEPMYEVMNAEARIAIRDRLPHTYNRFAKWKWLMVLFFLLNALAFIGRIVMKQN